MRRSDHVDHEVVLKDHCDARVLGHIAEGTCIVCVGVVALLELLGLEQLTPMGMQRCPAQDEQETSEQNGGKGLKHAWQR